MSDKHMGRCSTFVFRKRQIGSTVRPTVVCWNIWIKRPDHHRGGRDCGTLMRCSWEWPGLGNSWAVFFKLKRNSSIIWPSSSTPKDVPKRKESTCPRRLAPAHGSLIHGSRSLEKALMSVNKWIDKPPCSVHTVKYYWTVKGINHRPPLPCGGISIVCWKKETRQ